MPATRDFSDSEARARKHPASPMSQAQVDSGTAATYAAFSPTSALKGPVGSHRRSTIILHQKSPLLLATPPQITRALAYSYPFIAPLNILLGLLSWTSNDPWESFLIVALWWAIVLYGDFVIRIAGPLVLVAALIIGMYGRRFSALSRSGWSEFTAGSKLNQASGAVGTDAVSKSVAAAALGTSTTGTANETSADVAKDDKKSKRTASGKDHVPPQSTGIQHQKTLDEVVDILRELTTRFNLLLEPLLVMTDFLSTQRTATTASTRPALTTLFVRILICTPIWWALTLPPLRIITTRRVMLVFGTVVLTWHARVMRVARAILWRSRTVRRAAGLVTGLQFDLALPPPSVFNSATLRADSALPAVAEVSGKDEGGSREAKKVEGKVEANKPPKLPPRESELTKAIKRQQKQRGGADLAGVRFTFIIYENQRRWVGLGWTTSLFGYERAAWTDEHNNPVPPKDEFQLPDVEEGAKAQWRWAQGSRWRVDGVNIDVVDYDGSDGKMGWVYYDNKWQHGRRGNDGWGKWCRRRKWFRDAELVELSDEEFAEMAVQREKAREVHMAAAAAAAAGNGGSPPMSPPLPPPRPGAPASGSRALPPQISTVTASPNDTGVGSQSIQELADTSPQAATSFTSAGGSSIIRSITPSWASSIGSSTTTIGGGSGPIDTIGGTPLTRTPIREYDTASITSNSSRWSRSGTGVGAGGSLRKKNSAMRLVEGSLRHRSSSLAMGSGSEDADAAIGAERLLQITKAGAGAEWEVGDEVRMSLG